MTTVTINTLNEDWGNLSRELTAWLKQADQVIISTTDADKNIAAIRGQFPTVDIVTMPHGEHPGHSPLGSFMQLNNAMPHVKGEWWCFASGNDYVYPNKIADELATAKRTGALVVYSDFNYTDESGKVKSRQRFKPYDAKAHEHTNIIPDCSLIHRSIIDRFGPFRCGKYRNYSYWDMWLRARKELGQRIFAHNAVPTWGYRQGSADMHVKRERSPQMKADAMIDRYRMLTDNGITQTAPVVSFCVEDHANFMFENSRALDAVGIPNKAYKLTPHPYGYEQQADVVPMAEVINAVKSAKIVQVFFSLKSFNLLKPYLKGKHVVMHYAGSEFRQNKAAYLRAINPHVTRSVIALGEFNNCGAKNQRYVSLTVDVDALAKHVRPISEARKVGHYPSNPQVKGTDAIRRTLGDRPIDIDTELLPYPKALERMADCDIYIELFAGTQGTEVYGSFGTTAVEAAAMGKVVITMNLHDRFYAQEYGQCPLILVQTEADLRYAVDTLRALPLEALQRIADSQRAWATRYHSYSATGQRMIDQVLF